LSLWGYLARSAKIFCDIFVIYQTQSVKQIPFVMQLTLEQAATRLGKSKRQVLYMIQQGHVPAQKLAGRWWIESHHLPLSDGQQHSYDRKQRQLRAAVEEALDIAPEAVRPRQSEAQRLQLHPKRWDVLPNTHPSIFLGYRISRASVTPNRKLRRAMQRRLRTAATRGHEALVRSVQSYRGLLLF
jgi:hypothetical protein